jgi:hypothetical protein
MIRDRASSPDHWRNQADAAREIAAMMRPEAQGIMEQIADDYELLAKLAETMLLIPVRSAA